MDRLRRLLIGRGVGRMNDRLGRMESSTLYWLNSAEELRRSAKVLWSATRIYSRPRTCSSPVWP